MYFALIFEHAMLYLCLFSRMLFGLSILSALEKSLPQSNFSCSMQNNSLPLHPQFHAGDVCTSSAGIADILKRRLLALCSDALKSRKFQSSSELSNDRCPTGYRLSLLCLFWYSICVYTYAHTRTLNYSSTENVYIRRGLRVVVSR